MLQYYDMVKICFMLNLQGSGNVCNDCIQLVTDLQDAVRNNSTFVSSLIEHAKEECEHFAPAMSEVVIFYLVLLI